MGASMFLLDLATSQPPSTAAVRKSQPSPRHVGGRVLLDDDGLNGPTTYHYCRRRHYIACRDLYSSSSLPRCLVDHRLGYGPGRIQHSGHGAAVCHYHHFDDACYASCGHSRRAARRRVHIRKFEHRRHSPRCHHFEEAHLHTGCQTRYTVSEVTSNTELMCHVPDGTQSRSPHLGLPAVETSAPLSPAAAVLAAVVAAPPAQPHAASAPPLAAFAVAR